MSLIQSLAVWQWVVLALIPPAIILLYFLKLKRQPLEVPSTYLWSRTIEDLHVNSIWQRLRQNLLLFLQLLIIALVMLACLRPGWRGDTLTGDRFVFLIDTSASMQALDEKPTRLERAKEQALRHVDQMKRGDVGMVISCSDGARVEQGFTTNKRLLKEKIRRITPTNRSTDLTDALRYAAALANPNHTRLEGDQQVDESIPATVFIFSDGSFPAIDFSLGKLDPQHIKIGSPDPKNVAIVAFSTEQNAERPDETQAYARVENYTPEEVKTDIVFYVAGQMRDAKGVTIPAAKLTKEGQLERPGVAGAQFELREVRDTELKVELDHKDDLALDNVAYAAVNNARRAEILLVTPGNSAFRRALKTPHAQRLANVTYASPVFVEDKEYQEKSKAGFYDLVIYDQCQPKEMPQANTLFIGAIPPDDKWKSGKPVELPQIADYDRVHPLMNLVDVSQLRILDAFPVEVTGTSIELIYAEFGPMFVIAPRQGYEDAVLGMSIFTVKDGDLEPNTDWPRRRSFPVFVYNVVRYLGGSRGAITGANVQPAAPMIIRPHAPVNQVTVRSPSKADSKIQREGESAFIYTLTQQPGVYEVREGKSNEVAQRFAVNLFDTRESDLTPNEIDIGHEKVTLKKNVENTRRELWKWIVGIGLLVLVAEWYIYNRRVYL